MRNIQNKTYKYIVSVLRRTVLGLRKIIQSSLCYWIISRSWMLTGVVVSKTANADEINFSTIPIGPKRCFIVTGMMRVVTSPLRTVFRNLAPQGNKNIPHLWGSSGSDLEGLLLLKLNELKTFKFIVFPPVLCLYLPP